MNKVEIGKILARIRMGACLTQAQLGERLGKKQQTIASWEVGQSMPDVETLFALCQLCGTTVNDAFGFTEFALSEAEREHIEHYRALDARGRKSVDAVLKAEYDQCSPDVTEKRQA